MSTNNQDKILIAIRFTKDNETMLKLFEKRIHILTILFFFIFLFSLLLCLSFANLSILGILVLSMSLAIFFNSQKYWKAYQQAECTREKMVRNLGFDLLGLLLTMVTAMYCGQLAGGYFGLRAGFWIGLLAGFVGGFVSAWLVRSVWGKLVPST
jgi:hypothetical protein